MITLRQTIEESKSKAKIEWEKSDWLTYYIERPLSFLFTWPLLNMGITANTASFISIIFALVGFGLMSYGTTTQRLLGWLFMFLWSIFDCVDGNIARFNKTSGSLGELWDATAGYIAMCTLFLSGGMMASNESSQIFNALFPSTSYVLMGGISVAASMIPRVIMHKKARAKEVADTEFKDRNSFNTIKLFINNLMSITGCALFLLLIAIIFNICNLYTIGYCILNMGICIYSLLSLLKE